MERLERFAHGDLEAFESLFREFQGDVYRWTVRIVRNPADAEDLTIETFWRIYQARARFDPAASFGAWARRIATNAALDHLRAARPAAPLPENLPAAPAPDGIAQQEIDERIRSAFAELPPKFRVVATLALIEEQPYAEIAEALGISVGGVKSRVFRAVRRLRKKLRAMGVEP